MSQPKYPLLDKITQPQDLKLLAREQLPALSEEVRQFLIETVSKTGGHMGSGLGTVELTVALHYVLNSPTDKIIWDVSHQTYPHKILTGRKDRMGTLRQYGGLSGFTHPDESPHDHFHVAHAGTAISQALGLATARDFFGTKDKVVAVVGDGAMTSGLSFEGLNNAGILRKNMMIILNDNKMSIAKNVGAISHYLNKVITNPLYNRVREDVEKSLEKFPRIKKLARHSLDSMKHLIVPGVLFEELGFRYFGPVDGHDVEALTETLEKLVEIEHPIILHVLTEKGKGYHFAEKDAERFHGVVPFDVETGEKVGGSSETPASEQKISYTQAYVDAMITLAEEDPKVVALTAAMPSGTGLGKFQKKFPDRFHDVGIAEQHAVTFAGALSKAGLKPVCAIYSTFLQRAQDQLIHDISLQKLGLTVAMDRAGIAGADGPTHHGTFDIGYLSHIPDAVICSPKDEFEMLHMLRLGVNYRGVFALRYPRDQVPLEKIGKQAPFAIGEGEILEEGEEIAILSMGSMIFEAMKAAQKLKLVGVKPTVCNLRFARPLDKKLLKALAAKHHTFITVEDHVLTGGLGSRVVEFMSDEDLKHVSVKRFALPDAFVEHGKRETLLDKYGLSADKIASRILEATRLENREDALTSRT